MKIYLGVILLILPLFTFAEGERKGVFYYEKPIKQTEKRRDKKNITPPSKVGPTEVMEKLNETWKESLNRSILNPTDKNILIERKLSKYILDKSENYQQRASSVIARNPSINYVLQKPVDHAARIAYDNKVEAREDAIIRKLAKTHGLMFFYAGKCDVCNAFVPTVKRFAKKYNFYLLPATVDGVVLKGLPNTRKNTTQAQLFGVKAVPAIFAVNPKKPKEAIFISYGNLSVMAMKHNLIRSLEERR